MLSWFVGLDDMEINESELFIATSIWQSNVSFVSFIFLFSLLLEKVISSDSLMNDKITVLIKIVHRVLKNLILELQAKLMTD